MASSLNFKDGQIRKYIITTKFYKLAYKVILLTPALGVVEAK